MVLKKKIVFFLLILFAAFSLSFVIFQLSSKHDGFQFKRFVYAEEEGYLIHPKKDKMKKEEEY